MDLLRFNMTPMSYNSHRQEVLSLVQVEGSHSFAFTYTTNDSYVNKLIHFITDMVEESDDMKKIGIKLVRTGCRFFINNEYIDYYEYAKKSPMNKEMVIND